MEPTSDRGPLHVVGIGNAIVDVLTQVDDDLLRKLDVPKGAMTLIDAEQAERLYAGLGGTIECSGGSAANTMVGLASLGSSAAYIGKTRDDRLGDLFRRDIRETGVRFDTAAATDGPGSGRCIVLVTPDAQRTMQTYLGASATLGPGEIDEETVAAAAVTYLEGYLWDPPPAKEAFRKAAQIAHGAGRQVALSLSDAFCVDRHREEFRDLVENHVDVLFANEDEIRSLYRRETLDEAIDDLRGHCRIAALTRGAEGSVILWDEERHRLPAEPVGQVVDTTGAGDLYAAGFLHGLVQGHGLTDCGRMGAIAAAEIIAHFGARPRTSLEQLVAGRVG